MKPVFLIAVLALAACDGGASAVASRDHSSAAAIAPVETAAAEARQAPAPLVGGKPMWSSNSRYTARENAQYHFDRDGETFGAASLDEFVQKAHAFTASPPKGALTLTRANGDKLVYDPASNTFAVATRDGAPRTMFKPDDGMAYWEKQKADLNRQASRRPRDSEG
ncbi:MAG TPA: hypothetical protein VD906_07655 [Caulobacteraceae bacterium]|nr:hypothetical protein [Caulobacteraceae bacterium]